MTERRTPSLFEQEIKSISAKIDALNGLSIEERKRRAESVRNEISQLKSKAEQASLTEVLRSVQVLSMQLDIMIVPNEGE